MFKNRYQDCFRWAMNLLVLLYNHPTFDRLLQVNHRIEQYTYVLELKGGLAGCGRKSAEKGSRRVHLSRGDCRQLRYIPTEGINVLLSYVPILQERKIKLTLCNVNTGILRLFQLLKLDARFHINYDTNWKEGVS